MCAKDSQPVTRESGSLFVHGSMVHGIPKLAITGR